MNRSLPAPLISSRARNRALLARQHLLSRSALSTELMIEHLVGMQAQEPRDPYTALWSRIAGFEPGALERLLVERRALRMPVMRTTLHLVSARDALVLWPMSRPVLARVFSSSAWGKQLRSAEADLDAIVTEGAALLRDRPQTSAELKTALAQLFPQHDATAMAQAVHYRAPVVQVPPRGLWTRTGRAMWTTLDAWLGRSPTGIRDTEMDEIVLRYLAAFGPAGAADFAAWSGVTGARAMLERLRPRLLVLSDEQGRELFDLPHAPRPEADAPAPPRFFPTYDNLGLAHRDRSHVIPAQTVGRLDGWVGTFTVDGYLRGQWDVVSTSDVATIEVAPLAPLSAQDQAEVEEEALSLSRLHAPSASRHEVAVRPLSRWARSGGRPPTGR